MADIEKVIKTYECCRNSWRRNCDDCPIEKDCCHDGLPEFAIGYALELLKQYAVIKETISDEIHETAKMFRRTAGDNDIPLKW